MTYQVGDVLECISPRRSFDDYSLLTGIRGIIDWVDPQSCRCGYCQDDAYVTYVNGSEPLTFSDSRYWTRRVAMSSDMERLWRLVPPVIGEPVVCETPEHTGIHVMGQACSGDIRLRYSMSGDLHPAGSSSTGRYRTLGDDAQRYLWERYMIALNQHTAWLEENRARWRQQAASLMPSEIYRVHPDVAHEYRATDYLRVGRVRPEIGQVEARLLSSSGVTLDSRLMPLDHIGPQVPAWRTANFWPDDVQRISSPTPYLGVVLPNVDIEQPSDHICDFSCETFGCLDTEDIPDDDDSEGFDLYGGERIWNHSYDPPLRFYGSGPLFLGAEVEMSALDDHDRKERMAQIIRHSAGDLVYMKEDGSIYGHGIEMVTHPMTYDYALESWPRDLFARLREVGAEPHESCGMHVHVSRAGFVSPAHAYKWIKWIYRNRDEVTTLARRSASRWATFTDSNNRRKTKYHAKNGVGGNRYTAVNCTNDATYEVRVFASTLNRIKFLAALGLVDASIRYLATVSAHDILTKGAWGFSGFRDYVHSFEKYRPLQREMKRLGV